MSWRRGQTYSQDLRDRVLGANTLSARQAAERFGVSVSYVVKARQRLARIGLATPPPQKPCLLASWCIFMALFMSAWSRLQTRRWPSIASG
jgi:hypothetical protein